MTISAVKQLETLDLFCYVFSPHSLFTPLCSLHLPHMYIVHGSMHKPVSSLGALQHQISNCSCLHNCLLFFIWKTNLCILQLSLSHDFFTHSDAQCSLDEYEYEYMHCRVKDTFNKTKTKNRQTPNQDCIFECYLQYL